MHSAVYIGSVSHRRRTPRVHQFRYPLFMMYLDLAELRQVFRGRWLWGLERFALAVFKRADHMGDPRQPLDQCVRDLVARVTGRRPEGPIRLLTHLRYFGYSFNPVSFYYCYGAAAGDACGELETVVAEVNNTPWGEQHCYVLDGALPWRSEKKLHVSPFMPMDMQYEWDLSAPLAGSGSALSVHMRCERAGEAVFDANLALRRRPLSGLTLAAVLVRFPWMTARVVLAIHWQALRLWLKRVPVYNHPAA